MQRDHTYHIWPRNLDLSLAFRSVEAFALKRGMIWYEEKHQRFHIVFNRYDSARPGNFDEFLNTLVTAPRLERFECQLPFHVEKSQTGITFYITYRPSHIHVSINGTDDDMVIAAHEHIRREWRLANPPLPHTEEGRPRGLQATIFLGKHFDADSERPAEELRHFLELLRFNVQEAEEYRAQPIPEKVRRLIEGQDIYVGLVTGKREHSWLVSEASFAHGKGKHIMMVVEDGCGYNPTIEGRDYEQILFPPKLIEKSFIKLMEEFRSLGISGL